MGLTQEQQAEITARHLSGNMAIEIWLVPCIVTIVILLIVLVVMVALQIRQKKKGKHGKQEYEPAHTDSGEILMIAKQGNTRLPNGIAGQKRKNLLEDSA